MQCVNKGPWYFLFFAIITAEQQSVHTGQDIPIKMCSKAYFFNGSANKKTLQASIVHRAEELRALQREKTRVIDGHSRCSQPIK